MKRKETTKHVEQLKSKVKLESQYSIEIPIIVEKVRSQSKVGKIINCILRTRNH